MTLSKEEKLLTTASIGHLYRKFGIPGIIGLLCMCFQPMIDGLFLGNFVGPDALAGVNLFMPLYNFLSIAAVVMGIGCQTVISISLGQSDYRRANNAFRTAFVFLLFFTAFMATLCVVGRNWLGTMLGADATLMPHIVDYILHFAPFLPAVVLIFLADYVLKSIGRPYAAMSMYGLVLLINIVLDYLFIAKLGLGVSGAARATGLAFTVSCVLMFLSLLKEKNLVHIQKGKFDARLLRQMLYNGSSEGLSEFSAGVTIFLFNWMMMKTFGADGVAAFTAVNYILYLGVMLFVGLSDGIIPVFAYNYGAGNRDRLKKALFMGYKVNAVIGLIFFAILFFGSEGILELFFNDTSNEHVGHILSIAHIGASFMAFAFLFNGSNIITSSFFTSMGDARRSVYISLLRGLLMVIIGIAIYPYVFGENGIWLVIPIGEVVTFIYGRYLLHKKTPWVYRKLP